jgi:hypothetical protein
MTDEEMADKYGHSHIYYEVAKREDGTEYAKEVSSVTIKQAYLAGLKAGSQLDRVWHDYDAGEDCYEDSHEGKWVKREAGRPKWHKVADGDLPPEDTDVLALLADKEIYMAHFYGRNVWDKIGSVIAWCETPQYEEE